ncbi:MAG: ATP-binding cassette domain-containing protein [Candidatus Dormibacteraeota bacterium]|uniref:ATP-binding cassette domain-containing protein n=1 Tax=Candidatus Dormiibacter inghamiae TaxID=3127013 RepID=A0A934KBP1_9BACT|nr:ATP-binding cassette domain-containing protein [Candidatus Dormibacteraeota bacterium]MBJ7606355.1 ATP-binding cassette domain-containing protein [Candidatus Dormibacteraeota bacterium]
MEHPIATSGLTKRYSAHVLAVDRLELRVRKGEVYGFLGPNGAGKTTTLKMLVGLIRPTAGQAVVAGHAPGDPAGLARIGCLVESPAFYPYLSGRDNLRAAAGAAGAPESRVDAALDEVGLLPRGKDKFKTYSLGMKQRLGVGAALLKEPDLLILDEPSNGLDPQGMVEMRDLIRQLRQGQRTVLLSSHLLGEVQQICDRVGVINGGKLIKEGTIDEIRGGTSLLVVAQPAERALGLLSQRLGDKVRLVDGELIVDVEPQRAAEINHWLVSAGIGVWQLRSAERSLEDVFLQLTGPVGAQP